MESLFVIDPVVDQPWDDSIEISYSKDLHKRVEDLSKGPDVPLLDNQNNEVNDVIEDRAVANLIKFLVENYNVDIGDTFSDVLISNLYSDYKKITLVSTVSRKTRESVKTYLNEKGITLKRKREGTYLQGVSYR